MKKTILICEFELFQRKQKVSKMKVIYVKREKLLRVVKMINYEIGKKVFENQKRFNLSKQIHILNL